RRVAAVARCRQQTAARAAAGVLGDLGELEDVAELGRRAQLALADWARVGIEQRHQPVGDLLAGQALVDLARDLLGAIDELVETARGGQLGPGTAAARPLTQPARQSTRLAH